MQPGDVYVCHKFPFHDGEEGKKLFVCLSESFRGENLVFLTTSQEHRGGPPDEGCQYGRGVYHFRGKPYDKPTWIILHTPYVLNNEEFTEWIHTGRATWIFALNDNQTGAMKNCFARSDDCSPLYLKMMGK